MYGRRAHGSATEKSYVRYWMASARCVRRDGLRPVEISDRARDAQDAVIAAGGERHGCQTPDA